MSKIVFFGSVYRGHNVAPISLINTLKESGHEVKYFGLPKYSDIIELNTSAEFVPYPDFDKLDYLANTKLPTTGDASSRLLFLTQTTVDASVQLISWVEEMFAAKKLEADLIIYDNMALWGYVVAEKQNINHICSLTLMATNKEIMTDLGQGKIYLELSPIVAEPLQAFHAQGVHDIKDFPDIMTCGYNPNTILYTSPLFQHNPEFFKSNQYIFFPPKCKEVIHENNFSKENVNIYLSFGTVYNNDIELYQKILNQLSHHKNYHITVSAGGSDNTYNALQKYAQVENIKINYFVDQNEVLSHTDVFITHAGMNSVRESICSLVPMVTVPLVGDQNDAAQRLIELNAAKIVARYNLVEQIEKAVEDVVNEYDILVYNLQAIRASFEDVDLLGASLNRVTALLTSNESEL